MEQAWIQKMAREIARKVKEERMRLEQVEARGKEEKRREVDGSRDEMDVEGMSPPPAYEVV